MTYNYISSFLMLFPLVASVKKGEVRGFLEISTHVL